jgi:hypothetical protein
MTKSEKLSQVLQTMANKVSMDADTKAALDEALNALSEGTEAQRKAFNLITDKLMWFGSRDVLEAVTDIHAAMQVKEARKAIGLPPRGRGKSIREVTERQYEALWLYHLGELDFEAMWTELSVDDMSLVDKDDRTITAIYEAFKPQFEMLEKLMQK